MFWSRKKKAGLWNIFARTTTKLDFDTLAEPDWAELELTPIPADHDRREPFPILLGPDNVRATSAPTRSMAGRSGLPA